MPVYVGPDGQLGTEALPVLLEGAIAGVAGESDSVTDLRNEVRQQRRTIEELKERIARLEAAHAAAR